MRLEPIIGRRISVNTYLRPAENDMIRKAAEDANLTLGHYVRECMMAGFKMRMNEGKTKV